LAGIFERTLNNKEYSMNRFRSLLVIGLAFGYFHQTAVAQSPSNELVLSQAKHLITTGVNSANDQMLDRARSTLLPLVQDQQVSALALYYLGYIDFRMATIHPGMDKDSIVTYFERGIESLRSATEKNAKCAEAYALLGSCYGQKIRYYPLAGIILGPKSGAAFSTALALEPENPRVVLLDAISTYYTPALFGGSKEKGLQGFRKAAVLFDRWRSPDSLQPDWGYDEAYTWIGLAYLEQKEALSAQKAFQRALEINPHNGWVKYVLLPRADQILEEKKNSAE
jgi:tetratricopeptide (TPR) repeat protein